MKNNAITKNTFVNGKSPKKEKVLFVTIAGQGKNKDSDWKVESTDDHTYTVTNLTTNDAPQIVKMDNFTFEHNSLIELHSGKTSTKL